MDAPGQSSPAPAKGLHRLRRVAVTLLSTIQNRIELFGLELHEERQWTITTLIWAGAAIFLVGCALLMVTGTVVYLASPAVRPYLLVALTLGYVAAAAIAVANLGRRIHSKPPPFNDTVGELKKDIALIQRPDGSPRTTQTGAAAGERPQPPDSAAGAGPAPNAA
jgi:uncharacterized membrane protein YqjE